MFMKVIIKVMLYKYIEKITKIIYHNGDAKSAI